MQIFIFLQYLGFIINFYFLHIKALTFFTDLDIRNPLKKIIRLSQILIKLFNFKDEVFRIRAIQN